MPIGYRLYSGTYRGDAGIVPVPLPLPSHPDSSEALPSATTRHRRPTAPLWSGGPLVVGDGAWINGTWVPCLEETQKVTCPTRYSGRIGLKGGFDGLGN